MSECIDPPVLKRYEAGELPDHQADAVGGHVAHCARCAETVERLRRENLDARVLRAAIAHQGNWNADDSDSTAPAASGETRSEDDWNIPDYDRIRFCGAGAFGAVWVVRDRVGLYRALKTIDLSQLQSAGGKCRESTALEVYCRRVKRHHNLIDIHHVGMVGNTLYYVMELADDDVTRAPVRERLPKNYRPLTLGHVIDHGPISIDTAIEIVSRLLRGLCELHAAGLAHRDIKPANIVFVDRQPKLADIGMITADAHTPSHVGTPRYMPPDGRMDYSADTYALGRVLLELLGGSGTSASIRLPNKVARTTDLWDCESVTRVLNIACADEATDRYTDATSMLQALQACRQLTYDSLFAELDAAQSIESPKRSPYMPIAIAAINALPWLALAALVFYVLNRVL